MFGTHSIERACLRACTGLVPLHILCGTTAVGLVRRRCSLSRLHGTLMAVHPRSLRLQTRCCAHWLEHIITIDCFNTPSEKRSYVD